MGKEKWRKNESKRENERRGMKVWKWNQARGEIEIKNEEKERKNQEWLGEKEEKKMNERKNKRKERWMND